MNTKLFRSGEIITIQTNLRAIEKTLGEPIPGGLIDVSRLKDHILSPGEVITVCHNIRGIREKKNYSNPVNSNSTLEILLTIALIVIGLLYMTFSK